MPPPLKKKKNVEQIFKDYPFEEGTSYYPDEDTYAFQSHPPGWGWGEMFARCFSPRSLQTPGPTTALLNPNLHFSKIPSDSRPHESVRRPIPAP